MRKILNKGIALFFLASLLFIFAPDADAGIVLKVLTVNPSTEETQEVPVKVYLPKEAKPEDIIEKGDLKVAYDAQQGSYYAYGEYKLKPKEVLEHTIELRDIWVVSAAEMQSLRLEAEKINKLLKNTEFAERIKFMYHTMMTKLNEIDQRQKVSKANPEEHISEYRYNLKLLESVKVDLAVARSMLSKAKAVSASVVWKLIFFILIFLAVLGTTFYFLWYRQAKLFAGGGPSAEKKKPAEAREHREHEAKGDEKEADEGDIERILRGE
ncbi:MAG: hypothetical protein DRP85_04360 [Candidatus Makaraimicrobium thalassicum]|nr:MAG: hypothetical protein DRP85_04360 [Candidatus Omnitrophota bacterium]